VKADNSEPTISTNPILDSAARFWENERYDAFKICYQSMRIIDDLIDNCRAAAQKVSEFDKCEFEALVKDAIADMFVQPRLVKTRAKFRIPIWPWKVFSESMSYDLQHNGFRTLPVFLKYSEGAAVAPASVFMHLCGAVRKNGRYYPPQFDIRRAARPVALFCYLVHVIRDFQKDQKNNINYLAENLTAESGLNQLKLRKIAAGGHINLEFRSLITKYCRLIEYYRRRARLAIDKTSAYLEPRYALSLEIIYSLYLQIYERIVSSNGSYATSELSPSVEDVADRTKLTVSSFVMRKNFGDLSSLDRTEKLL
jgi:phytoene synthase